MPSSRRPSAQTFAVLDAIRNRTQDWVYGLELAKETGLKSGSLYPILIRCAERGLLDSRWLEPTEPGRPARHAYRIRPEGRELLDRHSQANADPRTGNALA